jgi:competence protein ComEA
MKRVSAVLAAGLLCLSSLGARAEQININEADAAALASLKGIGPARAEAIVEYRKANGPFRSIDDLTKIKGISAAFVDKNRDQLTVGDTDSRRRSAAASASR